MDFFKNISNKLSVRAKNMQLIPSLEPIRGVPDKIPHVENNAHRPSLYALPIQIERIKQDVISWRNAVKEAENAYYPHRYKMQQMFIDTILEGHISSCMDKRKRLTLLKDFKIGKKNASGQWVENTAGTKVFENKKWFKNAVSYGLDAQFYGYSLIQLGDLLKDKKGFNFKNTTILKRWHVSPDRQQYSQIPYQSWGLSFLEESEVDDNGVPFADWLLYVDTPSDTGSSNCGYGLLYDVAIYGIILRNNLAHNGDFTQMFSAPYRHIKTPHKYGSQEYNELENAAADMGSFGYLITSELEEIEFISGNTGTGYMSYADLEGRCQKLVSKKLLGHADAMDPTPGKLGSGQDGKDSPINKALAEIEKMQDEFALDFLNDVYLPKLRNLGFPIPEDQQFYFPNDKELFAVRESEDAANLSTAGVAKMMKDAGLKMDSKYFEERTGIPTEEVEEPVADSFGNKENAKRIKNKLEEMYSHKHVH
jgi:phage gp29-like protein